jgi:Uma2 family endonuclease
MNEMLHRFTVDDYHRMGDAGILAKGVRVELIRGRIVDMSPVGRVHVAMVVRLTRLLTSIIGDRAVVSVQNPIRLDNGSEPQPDIVVLGSAAAELDAPLPTANDAMLLIEVSDSSLAYDLNDKPAIYAEGGVREYWVVSLESRVVIVHRRPENGRYLDVYPVESEGRLAVEALPGVMVDAAAIWGTRAG